MAEEQDILLREIDEELKQEHLQKIWNKYGSLIIGGALILVASVAGFKFWQAHELNNRLALGERFSAAIAAASSGNESIAHESFNSIATDTVSGYEMLAKFQLAGLALKRGDWINAIEFYKLLIDDETLQEVYRELAIILGAFAQLEARSGNTDLIERARELAQGASPWRYSAKEIDALHAVINGETKIARTRYNELSNEASAPRGVRARAKTMIELLKN